MLHNMDAKYRTLSLKHLLWTALALGILADLLVWDRGPAASGFALWVLCFTGSFLALQLPTGLPRPTLPWLLLPPVAAGMLVWRAHEIHVFLVLLLLTLATTLVVALPRSSGSLELRIPALLRAFFHALARLAFGLPVVLQCLRNESQPVARNLRATAWLRGAILALPLLAVFTTLFYLADAGFGRLLDATGTFIGEEAGTHLLRSAVLAWLCTGLLYALLLPSEAAGSEAEGDPHQSMSGSLGREEITVIMGSLSLLFAGFTLLQLGYLFGGSTTIEMTPGLTVADYARRGFFELLTVSVLTLFLLMALQVLNREPQRFRLFATIMLACVFVMQASAVQRLLLYIDWFGLTLARWLAGCILLWVAAVLAWFGLTLWQSRIRGYIHGSLALGACLLLLWMADNPAARVASLNLQRHIENDLPLDTWYLHLLGTDAVPAVLEHFDALQEPQRCDIARQLLAARSAWQVVADEGWRHFSWSRNRALRAVAAREPELQALTRGEGTCPVSSPG